jgi:hypothetical protein
VSGRTAPSGDVVRGLVATWVALWLVVGAWVGYEVWQLSDLGATVAESGRALDAAGSGLQSLGDVPVVGDQTSQVGDQVRANADDIVAAAREAQSGARRLSVLLGLAVALVPSVPVLAVHLALRRGLLTADVP